jgi:hypothetical protein
MAINASAQWRIRAGGSNTNGGGYDSAISGAGTDYTDQDAAQLALTDLATSGAGSTTLTSVTGGFTAAMIGNCIRIRSGTNFQTGYYFITAHTDTNTVTLDRTPTSGGAGASGAGDLGGAFADFVNLSVSGNNGLLSPAFASPLAAGHTVYMRGSGSDDPAGFDWDYRGDAAAYQGYFECLGLDGSLAAGHIKIIGYNGRPHLHVSGLLFFRAHLWKLENIKFTHSSSGTGFSNYGIIGNIEEDISQYGHFGTNLIVDLNGTDHIGIQLAGAISVEIRNSGGGAAGTGVGLLCSNSGGPYVGCYVDGVRGDGFRAVSINSFVNCIARNCGRDGFRINAAGGAAAGGAVVNCTANNNTGSGIKIMTNILSMSYSIYNCIFSNNGAYGIDFADGTTALNDRRKRFVDYNCLYNNTSGARNGVSAGSNDVTTNPTFTDAAGENYSVGTNMKALGFPGAIRGSSSTGYVDLGAVQRQESAGTGGVSLSRVFGGF